MADQTDSIFTMSDATAHTWRPKRAGFYLILVGVGGSPNFNGQSVSVTQHGIAASSTLTSINSAVRDRVYLLGGEPVTFTPSGAVTSVQVGIANADD